MSEMRRTARALVERSTERFASRHDAAASRERLRRAFEHARIAPGPTLETEWLEEGGKPVLEARFLPSRRTLLLLQGLSIAMLALIALSAWLLARPGEGAERFLVPLFAVLSILALPFVTLGLGSARAAREARIRKAIRVALQDEDDRFPPPQRWADED